MNSEIIKHELEYINSEIAIYTERNQLIGPNLGQDPEYLQECIYRKASLEEYLTTVLEKEAQEEAERLLQAEEYERTRPPTQVELLQDEVAILKEQIKLLLERSNDN